MSEANEPPKDAPPDGQAWKFCPWDEGDEGGVWVLTSADEAAADERDGG